MHTVAVLIRKTQHEVDVLVLENWTCVRISPAGVRRLVWMVDENWQQQWKMHLI